MPSYTFEVIENASGVPLVAIIRHEHKKTAVRFQTTDQDEEWYAEFKNMAIFKQNHSYRVQNVKDSSSYIPDKTIKITKRHIVAQEKEEEECPDCKDTYEGSKGEYPLCEKCMEK